MSAVPETVDYGQTYCYSWYRHSHANYWESLLRCENVQSSTAAHPNGHIPLQKC